MFFWDPPVKKGGEFIFEGIFDFENFSDFLGDERRERRKEGMTELGNDWNDTTSALFKKPG
jgi:hypothetical protein